MGENGTFRTSFSGFHKGDVLNYIDSLQARQAEETASLREAVRRAEERAGEAEEKLAQALRQEEENHTALQALEEENARLKQQAEERSSEEQSLRLRAAAAEDYQREMRRLSQRLKEQEQRREEELQSRLAACREEESGKRRETQARCDQLQKELEELKQATAASRGGRERLEAVADAVSALERQLADNRGEVEQARQDLLDSSTAAGLKLEELIQELEESAAKAPAAAAQVRASETAFFR